MELGSKVFVDGINVMSKVVSIDVNNVIIESKEFGSTTENIRDLIEIRSATIKGPSIEDILLHFSSKKDIELVDYNGAFVILKEFTLPDMHSFSPWSKTFNEDAKKIQGKYLLQISKGVFNISKASKVYIDEYLDSYILKENFLFDKRISDSRIYYMGGEESIFSFDTEEELRNCLIKILDYKE